MESEIREQGAARVGPWLAVALCVAVAAAGLVGRFVGNRPDYAESFGPYWLPVAAGGLAAIAVVLNARLQSPRVKQALLWAGLFMMLWAANGLPIDVLRLIRLIPLEIDWAGMAIRALALMGVVMLARMVMRGADTNAQERPASWFGYDAFVLALVYPFFRTMWVFGGTVGLMRPGAAGEGIEAWLACTPWLLAAALSLLLVRTPQWMPRRLLLFAGWSATAIVCIIGPAAVWTLFTKTIAGDTGLDGIGTWVPFVFYGSWFLWGIAGGMATRAYQIRTAAKPQTSRLTEREKPSVQDRE